MRAFEADRAPSRDPRFTLAVLERAEAERWRAARHAALLRGAGISAMAASAALGLGFWVNAAPEAGMLALLTAAGLVVVFGGARRFRGRLQRT
ncbi:hypothetical protein U91I_03378 [alpha proteobacterium U9-1i]|nr:hypothetical protein U91I_03378 [alpha proteobacterium U9-1i]